MELNDLIARINFLYHKSREQGLTQAERGEQQELRRQYIDIIKGNVKNQLDRIRLVDENAGEHCCHPGCDCNKH